MNEFVQTFPQAWQEKWQEKGRFRGVTDTKKAVFQPLKDQQNVIGISPTGSGKTLSLSASPLYY